MNEEEKIRELVEKAISNAEDDRQSTQKMLAKILNEIDDDGLEEKASANATGVSNILNALQRSNEQIIKVGELLRKYRKESGDGSSLTTEELYKQFEEDENEEETVLEDPIGDE